MARSGLNSLIGGGSTILSTSTMYNSKCTNRYGSAVRVGPNCIILDDPKLAKTIYSTKGEFLKTYFYRVNEILQDGQLIQNIFSTRDNDWWSLTLIH